VPSKQAKIWARIPKRFIDRHVADSTLPDQSTVQTSPVDLIDRLKPDFEKRPAARSRRPVGKDHDESD
jgi:hypothetical protein